MNPECLGRRSLVLVSLFCCGCKAPQDRTEQVRWQYVWDTDDPSQKIIENSNHTGVPNHGAVLRPPVIAQDGTVYLVRPHEYTGPKGPSLVATGPVDQWEIGAAGGVWTSPVVADDGTVLFGTYTGSAWAMSPRGTKKWTYSF